MSANIGQIKVLADKDKYIYYNGSITVFTCIWHWHHIGVVVIITIRDHGNKTYLEVMFY